MDTGHSQPGRKNLVNKTRDAIMKQPELGKKIAELRKSQMLTQEELVEKCNISVRTIQRIEAGEVTPRDYTVKTIFGALNYDLNQVEIEPIDRSSWLERMFMIESDGSNRSMIKYLNTAWVFGIIYFVLRFFEGIAEYSRFMDEDLFTPQGYVYVKVGLLIAFVLFQRGFVIIGSLFENYLLKMITMVLVIAHIAVIGFDVYSIYNPEIELEFVILVYSVVLGAMGMIYGYALTRFSGALGRVSKLAGAVEIIAGMFSITVILSFISPFILIPAEILEIVVIFRATEIVRNHSYNQNK